MATELNLGGYFKPHGRILIRHQILKLLSESDEFDIVNIFPEKPHPKYSEQMPLCLVYFTSEELEKDDSNPRQYLRKDIFAVEVQIDTNAKIDTWESDYLDSRSYVIERILGESNHLHLDFVEDCFLIRERPIDVEYDGDVDRSTIQLFWEVHWRDCLFPDKKLDEFLRYNVKYQPVEPEGANAEDDVIIRTS